MKYAAHAMAMTTAHRRRVEAGTICVIFTALLCFSQLFRELFRKDWFLGGIRFRQRPPPGSDDAFGPMRPFNTLKKMRNISLHALSSYPSCQSFVRFHKSPCRKLGSFSVLV